MKLSDLSQYNKALVPVGVTLLLTVLGALGVTGDMRVEDAATLLLTALGVFLIPNKPEKK